MEAGRKGTNNRDNFNGLVHGVCSMYNNCKSTTPIHHVLELDQGEHKWKRQITILTKQQEQVPESVWKVRGMQQQEIVQDDKQ